MENEIKTEVKEQEFEIAPEAPEAKSEIPTEEELLDLGIKDIHREEDLPFVLEQFGKQMRGEVEVARQLPINTLRQGLITTLC